jgi:hypothetical protein
VRYPPDRAERELRQGRLPDLEARAAAGEPLFGKLKTDAQSTQ